MTETRITRNLSFSEFITSESRNVPFSREDLLAMAIDQLNDEEPLTIITKSTIFIISAESIADFLHPPAPQVVNPIEPKPFEPDLPGDLTYKPPV